MSCERFEKEGSEKLDRGEVIDPHFFECEDCRRALEAHQRVVGGLGEMRRAEPRENWQAGVWARIDQKQPAAVVSLWSKPALWAPRTAAGLKGDEPGRSSRPAVRVGLALAAAIVLVVVLLPAQKPSLEISFRESSTATLRSTDPKIKDRMIIRARKHQDLRVYFNENMIPILENEDGAELELKAAGQYRVVLFFGPKRPPPSSGVFDTDVARALSDGLEVIIEPPIEVR